MSSSEYIPVSPCSSCPKQANGTCPGTCQAAEAWEVEKERAEMAQELKK